MRSLRTFIGLLLVMAGLPLAVIAVAGLRGLQHQDPSGAFSADLAPVATAGYAVVVPDVAQVLDRHGATRLMGSGQIRLTMAASDVPLLVAVAPAAQVERYLRGVARSEVTRVGFAVGSQPVQTTDVAGVALTEGLPQAQGWRSARAGQTLELPRPLESGMAVVVVREDLQGGLAPVLSVAFTPGWLASAAWGMLLAGAAALLAGVALALWPVRGQEVLVVVEAHRMVDIADRIARKLNRDVDGRGRHRGLGALLGPPARYEVRPGDGSAAEGPDPEDDQPPDLTLATAGHLREPTGESPYVFTAT